MSKQRQKGTGWETELLPRVQKVYPNATRAGTTLGCNDLGDFNSTSVLLEAKKTDRPRFLEWARTCRSKAHNDQHHDKWAVLWSGDRRTETGQPLAVVDLDWFLSLLSLWEDR